MQGTEVMMKGWTLESRLFGCESVDALPNGVTHSGPHFPHLEDGNNNVNGFMQCWGGLNKLIHLRILKSGYRVCAVSIVNDSYSL